MNAMRTVPGQFNSFGHDRRADTADFVHAAYQLDPVTDAQRDAVLNSLRQLELERGERIQQTKAKAADEKGVKARTIRRSGLRDRTPDNAAEPAIAATPGDAPRDLQ